MTAAQFVKDNLPNHEERFCKWVNGDNGIGCMPPESFHEYHFREALENFRQSVWREACEAMRNEIWCGMELGYFPFSLHGFADCIEDTPIPNP